MTIKTVALIDWVWMGHHPAYFSAYARALIDCGCKVVSICPRPDDFRDDIFSQGVTNPSYLEQSYRLDGMVSVRKSIPKPLRRHWTAIRQALRIKKLIDAWEVETHRSIDLLFYACIFQKDWLFYRWASRLIAKPWSGLHIHARGLARPDTSRPISSSVVVPCLQFLGHRLHSLAVLDEGVIDQIKAMASRPVIWFPDVVDSRLTYEKGPSGLAAKLSHFAGPRSIVGCIGHLQRYKGVLELIEAAADARLANVCFAFIGEVSWDNFTRQQRQKVENFWRTDERCFVYPFRVPDGDEINSVMHQCSILCAAYHEFPHSSSTLTKACLLERPVVVNDGYLMADRVKTYGTGFVVKPGNSQSLSDAIVDALDRQRISTSSSIYMPGWRAYRSTHSYLSLTKAFATLLSVY